ncbi:MULTISPECIES: peptidoglycan-binding domain-containing protein [Streptomyces]|uniref:peptidoglycan-binding domain-containing protein n=1 Tax=Streptomyces aurantiacus group TaxID=2838335 RepID=UPI000525BADB|nr:peptidoglycan-binding domain-containing protein [Streptomyces yerevanensis]
MRAMTRTLVSVAAVVGIAGGSLTAAGTSFAAPAQDTKAVASAGAVTPLAVNNLGLSKEQAKNLQRILQRDWRYTGAVDGLLGTESWKAMQRYLKQHYSYTGAIDGIVGSGTVKALQRMLKQHYGYTGAIDGIAGAGTKAAFARFADDMAS